MLLQKRQFIPISSLEQNFTIYNMEEAASPVPAGLSTPKLPIVHLQNILYNGCHIGSGKFCCKHFSDCGSSRSQAHWSPDGWLHYHGTGSRLHLHRRKLLVKASTHLHTTSFGRNIMISPYIFVYCFHYINYVKKQFPHENRNCFFYVDLRQLY